MADLQHARDAKSHLRAALSGHRGVRAIGLAPTPAGYCLQVDVEHDGDGDGLPDAVDGVPVRVRVVGAIRAG